jgi:hypothetical protein
MKRFWMIAGLLAVTGTAAAWWMRGERVDPKVLEIETKATQLFSDSKNMTDQQRRAAWETFRESIGELTDQQRQQLRQRREGEFRRREEERLNQFFALSPAERIKELDQQIDRMERWRKEREQRRNRTTTLANRDSGASGGPSGRGGPGGRDGGFRGGPGSWTGADRNERRQQYLNSTTPQQRAMRTEYYRQLQQRMQQRGIQAPTRRWG